MSKYIINTDAVYGSNIYKSMLLMGTNGRGEVIVQKFNLDELEELNADYINGHYGSLQDEAYQRGLEDGKEQSDRGCEGCKWKGMTGQPPCIQCSNNYPNVWQKQDDKIEVGDEVIYNNQKFIVFAPETEKCYASLFDVNGRHASADHRECKKTGRHFDIPKILEEMRT